MAVKLRWGSHHPFLLVAGLSACVLEIPVGSWELSLLLQLELLHAAAAYLPVAYFCLK